MIDTITIRGPWRLRQTYPGRRKLTLAGVVKVWTDTTGTMLESAECSLPRLLYGHNGKVLANQAQLDAALAKLDLVLRSVADGPGVGEWTPYRLDLVWNFDLPAKPLIFAHAPLRVPGIQRRGTLFPDGDGVSWRGAKSGFMVTFYDKARQRRVPGSVLRAEISLRGHQLSRRLVGCDWRDFSALYRMYRGIMVGIDPIQKPVSAKGWPEAVGQEPPETRTRILAQLAHRPRTTFRRLRRRLEAAAAHLPETFSWANILPADNPPPAFHVE